MKKQVLFTILMLLSMVAMADDSGTFGENLTWTYTESNHTLIISGTGAMRNYDNYSYGPWKKYRTEIKKVIIKKGVTSIGTGSFAEHTQLSSVEIPDGITSIGERAFRSTALTMIDIPNSVIYIGQWAFESCVYLKSAIIGTGITELDRLVFSQCSSLNSITFHCKTIGNWFINTESIKTVTIGTEVEFIGEHAFSDFNNLTTINISNSVTSIGASAFSGCTGLTSITIPNSVTSIGSSAFYGCTGLTSINIPNSVTSIGNGAFSGCTGLTSIEIPNSVTSIGGSAFYGCTGLTSIKVENNPKYDSRNNCNAIIETETNALIVGCQNTIIPNSVTTIGDGTFNYCTGLTSINIPNSVTSIGSSAFMDCTALTSIEIPNSVTSIGNYAFSGCTGLTSLTFHCKSIGNWFNYNYKKNITKVTIGDEVETIGSSAFSGFSGLTSIEIPNSVTSIGKMCFYGCNSINTITLSSNLTSIGEEAFPSHKTTNLLLEDLSSWITFNLSTWKANPLNNSEECCFILNGTEIRELIIPEGVQSISSGVFYNGKNITSVTFPQSVTSIGWSAFYGCTGLTSIEIPSSVTSIGSNAFYGCTGLKSFTVHNNRPPSATSGITSQEVYDNCILYVLEGSENIYYASTFWNAFKTIQTIGAVEKVPQDVNGDGIVDTQDVLEIYKYIQEH